MILEDIQEEKQTPLNIKDQSKISDLVKLSKNEIQPFLRPAFTPSAFSPKIVFVKSDEDSNS